MNSKDTETALAVIAIHAGVISINAKLMSDDGATNVYSLGLIQTRLRQIKRELRELTKD